MKTVGSTSKVSVSSLEQEYCDPDVVVISDSEEFYDIPLNMVNPDSNVILRIDGTMFEKPKQQVKVDANYNVDGKSRCHRMASFQEVYKKPDEDKTVSERCRQNCAACCTCSRDKCKNILYKVLPSIRIMRKYERTDLIKDLICGLTVGIMQLPQGMAYAMLAELPPVVGLYMSFFPALMYFLFGTSRHISMGTVAVVSLLTGSVIARFYKATNSANADALSTDVNGTMTSLNDTAFPADDDALNGGVSNELKIGIAGTLALLVGFTQVIMGLLHMGFVTTYMSDPLVSGFTTGTAIHVGTSQVKYIFGLKIPRTDGMFQVIKTYKHIFENITKTNSATVIISAICIVILYLVKVQVNQRFKSKMKLPVPIELIVVVAGTLASHYGLFHDNYRVKVVGEVPAGLPQPALPSFHGLNLYITEVFIIGVISFAQSVSLAALFAKKHCYNLDANQELVAYGIGNIFGSFFSCYPIAASVSRSSVQESAGGRSQVASLFSASLVLVVILWIGPLFEALPNCVLASIIVVALRSLILQILDLPKIWKTSRYDFFIWVITFACTTVLHVDYGLLIGLVFSFFSVVVRSQKEKAVLLEKNTELQLYTDSRKYIKTKKQPGVKIVGLQSPLYYANGDIFVRQLRHLTGAKPEKIKKMRRKMAVKDLMHKEDELSDPEIGNGNVPGVDQSHISVPASASEPDVHHIIIDCSAITFIDTVGSKILKQIFQEYKEVDIDVFLACVNDEVWRVLKATEFTEKYKDTIFLTLDDAVKAAKHKDEIPEPEKLITYM